MRTLPLLLLPRSSVEESHLLTTIRTAKATDENLTSEDWGAIIELCDRVGSDQNGPKEVVQSMIKRLAHRNANVQLYTLEVSCVALPLPEFLTPVFRSFLTRSLVGDR